MAKIVASVSKKVPVPGVDFSNQQFSGTMEVELPEGATDDQLQARFQELYALLSQTVDGEIAAATDAARAAGFKARFPDPDANPGSRDVGLSSGARRQGFGLEERERNYRQGYGDGRGDHTPERQDDRRDGGQRSGGWQGRNGNGGGRGGAAMQAQVKAVFGIAKASGVDRRDLIERVEDRYGVRRIEDLNVRQASELIK